MVATLQDMLCLHVCIRELSGSFAALLGLHRSSRAHGFWPLIVHFPGESAYFGLKLSDRILRGERSSVPAERGGHRR